MMFGRKELIDPDTGRYRIGGNTKVRVWQIFRNYKLDEATPYNAFRGCGESFDELEQKWIHGKFNPRLYELVFDGRLDADHEPENVYMMLQGARPIELSRAMYSLSIGDIIELDNNGRYLMVVGFGFEDITDKIKGPFQ